AVMVLLVAVTGATAGWLGTAGGGDAPGPVAQLDTRPAAITQPPAEPPKVEPPKTEPPKTDPAKAGPPKTEPPRGDPTPEPPLPKVQTRAGLAGPDNFDQVIEWLRGNQFQQLVAIGSLAKAEVFPPRQAEVARELEKLLNGNDRLVALESTKALFVWAT